MSSNAENIETRLNEISLDIHATYGKSVGSVIEVGNKIIAATEELGESFAKLKLPFSASVATNFTKVANTTLLP